MSFVATAVVGGAVIGAGASMIGSSKSAKAISSSGQAAADAQVQAAEIGADLQREMFYKSLGLQAPQRYAGNMALESMMREVYGSGFKMPEGYNPWDPNPRPVSEDERDTSSRTTGIPEGEVPKTLAEAYQTHLLDQWWQGEYDKAMQNRGGDEAPPEPIDSWKARQERKGNLVPPDYLTQPPTDSDRVARPMIGADTSRALSGAGGIIGRMVRPALADTGLSKMDGLQRTRDRSNVGPVYTHAPAIDTSTSALYQLQQEEGTKAITAALAARGLNISGAGMGTLSDFYRKLAAQEAMRKQALLESIAGYGNTASAQGATAAMNLGSDLSRIYTGMGDARANALLTAGQARANNYMNTANTIGSLANLGVTLYGMGAFNAPRTSPTSILV